MTITTTNLRLEVEAESPRNRITFGTPTPGTSANDLHSISWIAQNSATVSTTPGVYEIAIRKTSPSAGQLLAISPDYAATPGELWRINTHTDEYEGTGSQYRIEAQAFNGATSLGVAGSFTRTSTGSQSVYRNIAFLTPPGTTKIRMNFVSVTATTLGVRISRERTYVGRGPALFGEYTLTNAAIGLAGTSFIVTPSTNAAASIRTTQTVTPGQWVAAAVDVTGGQTTPSLVFYNGGSVLQTVNGSVTSSGNRASIAPVQAPAATTSVRLLLNVVAVGGGTPTTGTPLSFENLVLNVEDKQLFADRTGWAEATRPNNLLPNSSGEMGSFGWETPIPDSTLNVSTSGGTQRLVFSFIGGKPAYLWSEPQPVTPGKYIGASWTIDVRFAYRQVIEFMDADLNVISTSTQTPYLSQDGSTFATPFLIPAGANYARLRFDFYYGLGGTNPPTGTEDLRELVMSEGDTALQASGLPYVEAVKWLDIIKPAHEISINRAALDVGTLTAKVLDPDLDPAQAPDVRPGKRVRVTVKTPGAVWESLFEGTISNASTTYKDGTEITLTASDGIKAAANTSRPNGVGTINDLRAVLEGAGVPYLVNGSASQIITPATVAVNESASALDQVAITRDTALGFAWVNRKNVMIVNDASQMSATPVGTVNESVYRSPEVNFNTDNCINEVTVKYLRTTGDSTEEIVYGPYRDTASIAKWGRYSSEYTIQSATESAPAIAAYAQAILTANSTPRIRINAAEIPISTVADLTTAKALLDLYDLVTVAYAAKGINETSRVTGISHSITPGAWTMTLDFGVDGAVAAAQLTPSPTARIESIATYNFTDKSPFSAAAQLIRVGNIVTCIGSFQRPSGYSTGFTTAADIPEGFRIPGGSILLSANPVWNSSYQFQARIQTTFIEIRMTGANPNGLGVNTAWFTSDPWPSP